MLTKIIQSENTRQALQAASAKFKPLERQKTKTFIRHTPKKIDGRTVVLIRAAAGVLLLESDDKGKAIQVVSDMGPDLHKDAYKEALAQIGVRFRATKRKGIPMNHYEPAVQDAKATKAKAKK